MVKKNLFSILVALLIMYLSLTSANTFEKVSFFNKIFNDKFVHFVMYFVLMSVIIFENRKTLISTVSLFLIALVPLFYGVLMEILQSMITDSRSGNFFDVIINSAGILASLLLWLWIKPSTKEKIK